MPEKLERKTDLPIPSLIIVATRGDGPGFGNSLPNCMAMNELGVVFLNTEDTEERQGIEKTFVEILQNPDAGEHRQFVAFAFLKRPDAITNDITKSVVSTFENNPANEDVVTTVNARLARD